MYSQFFLFINTIKFLKISQIYYRIVRKILKPKIKKNYHYVILDRSQKWEAVELFPEKISTKNQANFINQSKSLSFPKVWCDINNDLLWTFNLHYFEDFVSQNANKKASFHLEFFNKWIKHNHVGTGIGWHAYPLSLRISNIL